MEGDGLIDVTIPQVESGYVAEGDHKTMAKAIKDRVSLIRRKREQRQLVREEQEKRKQESEQQMQQQQQEAHKPSHTQVCSTTITPLLCPILQFHVSQVYLVSFSLSLLFM